MLLWGLRPCWSPAMLPRPRRENLFGVLFDRRHREQAGSLSIKLAPAFEQMLAANHMKLLYRSLLSKFINPSLFRWCLPSSHIPLEKFSLSCLSQQYRCMQGSSVHGFHPKSWCSVTPWFEWEVCSETGIVKKPTGVRDQSWRNTGLFWLLVDVAS